MKTDSKVKPACPAGRHTPGEWEATKAYSSGTIAIFNRLEGYGEIANVLEQRGREYETQANAALIAADPELLEALKSLIDDVKDAAAFNRKQGFYDIAHERHLRIDAAYQAIRKAEGADHA